MLSIGGDGLDLIVEAHLVYLAENGNWLQSEFIMHRPAVFKNRDTAQKIAIKCKLKVLLLL